MTKNTNASLLGIMNLWIIISNLIFVDLYGILWRILTFLITLISDWIEKISLGSVTLSMICALNVSYSYVLLSCLFAAVFY